MEDLSKYTPTQLLKMVNDTKAKHETLKGEIVEHTNDFDSLVVKINEKLEILSQVEKHYIELIEELNNKNAI